MKTPPSLSIEQCTERPARGGAFVLTTAPVSYNARCVGDARSKWNSY